MHQQLQAIIDELNSAQERLRQLAQKVAEEKWSRRPEPGRWSVADCVAHLNLTSLSFLPRIRKGLAEARKVKEPAPMRYRRDPVGWFLWKTMPPPAKFRVRSPAAYIPQATHPPAELMSEFARLQTEQIACVSEADGLAIHRVRIPSPLDARVKYNLFSCLSILPPHQHRHLWQAEEAFNSLSHARD